MTTHDKNHSFTPEDLFMPSKKYPNGTDGEWTFEVDGVMVTRIYEDGKLVSEEPCNWSVEE